MPLPLDPLFWPHFGDAIFDTFPLDFNALPVSFFLAFEERDPNSPPSPPQAAAIAQNILAAMDVVSARSFPAFSRKSFI